MPDPRYATPVKAEVICVACHWRGWASWLSCHLMRDHDCPGCGKIGLLVATGQDNHDAASALDEQQPPCFPLGHRIITPREGMG